MSKLPPRNGSADPRSLMDEGSLEEATTIGYPRVARQLVGREGAMPILGFSIALLLGAFTLFGMTMARSGEAGRQERASAQAALAAANARATAAALRPPLPPVVAAPATAQAAPPALPAAAPPMAPPFPPAGAAMTLADRNRAPALVFDQAQSLPAAPPVSGPPAAGQGAARGAAAGLTADEQFALRLVGDAGSAGATSMDAPAATIAQGTLIAAVLETAINSDLPGYVRAVISRDVRSFDGGTVLVPRGSHVIGEYKSCLAVGQTRAFVLWTRLLRPDGVSVALGSPATDSAGSNGLPGTVNGHFGKRFGAAILLSMITAGGQAVGGSGATLVIAGPAQAASSIVQHDVNIPPTVQVKAGQPIRIFVARDLDFSPVHAER